MHRLTIAIPVFNEEKHIAKALESARAQADEILLLDNASTDNTRSICEYFTGRYPHIRYLRHRRNLGAFENLYQGLLRAKHPYFMWLGAHDMLKDGYTETLLRLLASDPQAVHAYCNALNMKPPHQLVNETRYTFGDELASPFAHTRVFSILRDLGNCSLFHGIYARKILLRCFPKRPSWTDIMPLDHNILARIALSGKMLHSAEALYVRMHPREERTAQEKWQRVLVSCYPEKSPVRHYHWSFVPRSVYRSQIQTAAECFRTRETPDGFMTSANEVLLARWGKFLERRR